jgi:branched-chain amino acid aminotransferase
MGRQVVIDGRRYAPEDAKVSVYDRGFLYGDSVFETVRTYRGEPFALDEHLRRLEDSAGALKIPLPIERAALASEVAAAVAAAGNPESRIRIIVTRGRGPLGLDSALAGEPLRAILVEPLELPPAAQYREGIGVVCVQTVRASDAVHSAKLSNYLASVLALQDARAAGAQEALVVNRDGLVVEGTTCNVFIVRRRGEGEKAGVSVCTPPLGIGVLPGITRALVMRVAEGLGLPVLDCALRPEQIRAADEVFVTSSIREILPVVSVDGEPVGDGQPGEITRRLHAAFRAEVGLGDRPLPWE